MLIGICGGICSGKSSIADYLVREHYFKRLYLERTVPTPSVEKSATNASIPRTKLSIDGDVPRFEHVEALLDFVTKRWRQRWVTTDIWDGSVLDVLQRRPFFLLVSVDAPVSVRWERFKARCAVHNLEPPTLTEFVLRNDEHLYAPRTGLAPLLHRAQLRLLNSAPSLTFLHDSLRSLDLPDETRLRPTWDAYFMQLAELASHRSNCMKRRVGCVLVRERRVISTGYNGTPRGLTNCNAGGCLRCNSANPSGIALDACLCLHAEENALLEAGRERINAGSSLYCSTCPCLTCSVKIAQMGVAEVVYHTGYSVDGAAAIVFKDAGVRLRQFSPPKEGLVDLNGPFRQP